MSTLQKYHSDFYVYLFSNGSPSLYPQNTPSEFTTELHTPINFSPSDVSNWEVGLTELIIPSTYYNITEGANVISVLTTKAFRERAALEMATRLTRKRRPTVSQEELNARIKKQRELEAAVAAAAITPAPVVETPSPTTTTTTPVEVKPKVVKEEEEEKYTGRKITETQRDDWYKAWDKIYEREKDRMTLDEIDELQLKEWEGYRKQYAIEKSPPPASKHSREYEFERDRYLNGEFHRLTVD
jgi:hypothetical protein